MPRRLGYADRWVWELTQTIEPYDCQTGLSDDDALKLFSALMTGADLAYPEQSHRLMWLMWQLLDCDLLGESENTEVIRGIVRYIHTYHQETIEDELKMLKIEYISGQPYLEMDCGCGERKYFSLSETPIDPDTGAPAGNDAIPPGIDIPSNGFRLPDGTFRPEGQCYLNKVRTRITARLIAYVDAVFRFLPLGLPALNPLEGVSDLFAIARQATGGNAELTAVLQAGTVTAQEVKNLITAQQYQDRLGAAIEKRAGSALSRNDLRAIVIDAQGVLYGVDKYLQTITGTWAETVNLQRLNEELAVEAASCESGVSDPLPFVSFEFVGGTRIYRVTSVSVPFELGNQASPTNIGAYEDSAVGFYIRANTTQAGSAIRNPAIRVTGTDNNPRVLMVTDALGELSSLTTSTAQRGDEIAAGYGRGIGSAQRRTTNAALPPGVLRVDNVLTTGAGTNPISTVLELLVFELVGEASS